MQAHDEAKHGIDMHNQNTGFYLQTKALRLEGERQNPLEVSMTPQKISKLSSRAFQFNSEFGRIVAQNCQHFQMHMKCP